MVFLALIFGRTKREKQVDKAASIQSAIRELVGHRIKSKAKVTRSAKKTTGGGEEDDKTEATSSNHADGPSSIISTAQEEYLPSVQSSIEQLVWHRLQARAKAKWKEADDDREVDETINIPLAPIPPRRRQAVSASTLFRIEENSWSSLELE